MKILNKEEALKIFNNSYSKKEVSKKLGYTSNYMTNKLIKLYGIDISHFNPNFYVERKYENIKKKCPVCSNVFTTKKGHRKEKSTCSYSCVNTYFRTGKDHPSWNGRDYRRICFSHHEKKCIVCGEDRVLDVHHLDEGRENNDPANLIPLCPNHHRFCHTEHKHLIINQIEEYVKNFKN